MMAHRKSLAGIEGEMQTSVIACEVAVHTTGSGSVLERAISRSMERVTLPCDCMELPKCQ